MGNLFFIQTMKFRRSFSAIANSTSPSVLSRPILSFFPPLTDSPRKKKKNSANFSRFQTRRRNFRRVIIGTKYSIRFRRNVQHVQHLCLPQRAFITINSSSAINRRTDKILHRGKKVSSRFEREKSRSARIEKRRI